MASAAITGTAWIGVVLAGAKARSFFLSLFILLYPLMRVMVSTPNTGTAWICVVLTDAKVRSFFVLSLI